VAVAKVIIWPNGPFGIGKSTTAQALLQHLPEAVLVHRFRLVASEATLRARILQRPETDGPPGVSTHLGAGKLLIANPAFGEGERHHDEYPGGGVSLPQTNLGIAG
jgi:hypothetical protein